MSPILSITARQITPFTFDLPDPFLSQQCMVSPWPADRGMAAATAEATVGVAALHLLQAESLQRPKLTKINSRLGPFSILYLLQRAKRLREEVRALQEGQCNPIVHLLAIS